MQRRMISLLVVLLCCAVFGCWPREEPREHSPVTYTLDEPAQELIIQAITRARQQGKIDREFRGLYVPEKLLPWEPYVLALSTESKVPSILLLDAPWVPRYGVNNWLYALEQNEVLTQRKLVQQMGDPLGSQVRRAFSVLLPGQPEKQLVALPTEIRGNILFFRQDLLRRYRLDPPRTWDELKAICRRIMPQERSLKYGLIFHPKENFLNDFLPILWGYNGQVVDDKDRLILQEENNRAACLAALTELKSMQGAIIPAAKDLGQFESYEKGLVRQAFFRGEALFMINWDTRLHELKALMQKEKPSPGYLTDMNQIGVAPIPCKAGHANRYATIGSFGWAINRFAAVASAKVVENAKVFINFLADDRYQVEAAEKIGRVPISRSAREQVKNAEVWKICRDAFAASDLRFRSRPYKQRIYGILEKYLSEALYDKRSPAEAIELAVTELKDFYAPGQ